MSQVKPISDWEVFAGNSRVPNLVQHNPRQGVVERERRLSEFRLVVPQSLLFGL